MTLRDRCKLAGFLAGTTVGIWLGLKKKPKPLGKLKMGAPPVDLGRKHGEDR